MAVRIKNKELSTGEETAETRINGLIDLDGRLHMEELASLVDSLRADIKDMMQLGILLDGPNGGVFPLTKNDKMAAEL